MRYARSGRPKSGFPFVLRKSYMQRVKKLVGSDEVLVQMKGGQPDPLYSKSLYVPLFFSLIVEYTLRFCPLGYPSG